MSKFLESQNSFAAGMLSPKMRGRTDLPEYKQGAEEITNALAYKQGGLYRRPATEYLNNFANTGVTPDLIIPIAHSNTFLAVMEDGVPKLLAYYGDITVGSFEARDTFSSTPPPIPAYNNCLILGKEYNGDAITIFPDEVTDFMTIGETTIITRENDPPLVFYRASYVVGSGTTFTQSGWHLHLLSLPIDMTTLVPVNPSTTTKLYEVLSMPYLPVNIDTAKTFTASATTGSITVTANWKFLDGNSEDMIGRYLKYTVGASTGVMRITSTDNTRSTVGTSQFSAMVIVTLPATTATNNWQMSVIPHFSAVSLYQQRLILAQDNVVYGSQIGNIQRFMIDKLAQDSSSDASGLKYYGAASSTDPFEFILSARNKDVIVWLESGESLEVGTDKREYTIGATDNGALSATNVNIQLQTAYGSYPHRSIKTNKSTIIISREQNFIRRFEKYLDGAGAYKTYELNLYADNMIPNIKFKKIVYESESSVIWALTEDNDLVTCTFHEESGVTSWAKHEIAGTNVVIKDICVNVFQDPILFSQEGHVYLIIQRTIDGNTATYFERIGLEFRDNTLYYPQQLAAFSDSCLRKEESPATDTLYDLDHLEGETVDVLVNGILEQGLTVTSGSVTTTNSGTEFFIGLPFTTTIKTMPIETNGGTGTAQGITKRIEEVYFKFYNSKGVIVANADGNNAYPVNFGDLTVPDLETGDILKKIQLSPNLINQFIIKQTKSLPMNLLSYVAKGVTYD